MKNRNLKYGGVAVALTAAFIAIVVVVNVIFTALSAKFNWYTDLTSAGIYSISDGFKSVLDSLVADTDENTTVNVVLMSEEDRFASSSTEAGYVYKTLKQVEAYCDKNPRKGHKLRSRKGGNLQISAHGIRYSIYKRCCF